MVSPDKRWRADRKSFFDFIGRTEIGKYSRLSRNAETGDSDKEALFASDGGVEVSEFLGGDTRQATRGARRWSWTILEEIYTFLCLNKKRKCLVQLRQALEGRNFLNNYKNLHH
ncbi:hypothetical protein [Bacillus sp. ISL-55]|uniref:hypothetical protein n=1 Tax=Bacillus sp. ISL-55 TaxID=2819134 RepID=UPI001BED30D6|nr:hypothetical protein [Bacillus sp. ISL-55]MBT2693454.1 hypothetical protein [Bacillus sp. ISL-55]